MTRVLPRVLPRVVRSALGLVAFLAVAAVFLTGYTWQREAQQVWPQQAPPSVRLPAADLATFRAAAATPPGVAAAPIVLKYHEFAAYPDQGVTVQAFARHMAMLHAAGYRALTGEEFVAIRHGHPAPPRSVLITFDGGTQGLWTQADPILARYGFHAVAFLITARMRELAGARHLSWAEARRMVASGRWTFGSHSRDSRRRVAVDAAGTMASKLASRRWRDGARESMRAFRIRVDTDLLGSIRDLTRHGLPAARMFAYPYSEASLPAADPAALGYVNGRVATLFEVAFSSRARPMPFDGRTRGRMHVISDRLEIYRGTSARRLFEAMQRMRTIPVGQPWAGWRSADDSRAPLAIDGGRLTVEGSERYVAAQHAPQATGDWTDYQVSATVRGLAGPGSVTARLSARVGGAAPVRVRLSDRQAEVSAGGWRRMVDLPPQDSHLVVIEVRDGRSVVVIDGVRRADRPVPHPVTAAGGIGIAVFRSDPGAHFPVFGDLRVTPLART